MFFRQQLLEVFYRICPFHNNCFRYFTELVSFRQLLEVYYRVTVPSTTIASSSLQCYYPFHDRSGIITELLSFRQRLLQVCYNTILSLRQQLLQVVFSVTTLSTDVSVIITELLSFGRQLFEVYYSTQLSLRQKLFQVVYSVTTLSTTVSGILTELL